MLIRWKSKDKNSNSSSGSKKKRKGREGGMQHYIYFISIQRKENIVFVIMNDILNSSYLSIISLNRAIQFKVDVVFKSKLTAAYLLI